MQRRLKSLERRLARVAAIIRGQSADSAHARNLRNARRITVTLVRAGLEHAGIDPAEAVTLRRYEATEAPLPSPPLRQLDPREVFFARMRTLAERMRGKPPSLATASPAMLLAYYCFGDGAKQAPS